MLSGLSPSANELIDNLNDRVVEVQMTMDRVNDLLNDTNRGNISATSGQRRRYAEGRPSGGSFDAWQRE